MPVAVSIHDLTKVFPDRKVANNAINLEINQGEIFAILGPNGAGKTTLVRQVTTELIPTAGTICIFGIDISKDSRRVTSLLGVVPQEIQPYGDLTVHEHVYYLARLRGLAKLAAQGEAARVLSELELSDYRDKLVGLLSGGLKRRVIVAAALTGSPKLLILDEPSAGLDPAARRNLWEVLKKRVREGGTILLTTHYVEEAESLANRVAFLKDGRVVVCGKPDVIKSSVTGFIRLTLVKKENHVARALEKEIGIIQSMGLRDVQPDSDGNLIIHVKQEEKELIPAIYEWALGNQLDVRLTQITLEDAYLNLLR